MNLVGTAPVVTLGGVDSDFVGGVCSIPGIEQIVGLFLPDVEDMMRTSLTSLLGDADTRPGRRPGGRGRRGALGQLNIAGDIGTALGLTLDSTPQSADEDLAGQRGPRLRHRAWRLGAGLPACRFPGDALKLAADHAGACPSTRLWGAGHRLQPARWRERPSGACSTST